MFWKVYYIGNGKREFLLEFESSDFCTAHGYMKRIFNAQYFGHKYKNSRICAYEMVNIGARPWKRYLLERSVNDDAGRDTCTNCRIVNQKCEGQG